MIINLTLKQQAALREMQAQMQIYMKAIMDSRDDVDPNISYRISADGARLEPLNSSFQGN